MIPSSFVRASANADAKPEADANAEPEAAAEPAGYSTGSGPYAGYYGAHMGPTYYRGPMSYANYGYKSYGYGGRSYRYKRDASSS